jgi:16S rRNA (cytosine967-C5)-methyltransferase
MDRDDGSRRLRSIPWHALAGLGPHLDAPLAEVLAAPACAAGEVEAAPASAERVLDRFLRARRGLGNDARRACAEAIFGVALWRRRLSWHLGDDAAAPAALARHPPRRLLAALLRDLAGFADGAPLLDAALPPPRPPPPDLARRCSLPDWLAGELARAAGPGAALELAAALNVPGPVSLRVNGARATPERLVARLAAEGIATRPARFTGLRVVGRANLYASGALREGLFEVQDEGSQLAGAILGAARADRVLDLCAGAGGKSLQLAAGGARVHACDPDARRLARLAARAARAGAGVTIHGAAPPPDLLVDHALVDAPCSELGPLRRGPDVRFRLDPRSFAALPAIQLELLARAARHVRAGGRLAYVTCTFRREENDDVALEFERGHPPFERVAPSAPAALVDGDLFLRLMPHRHDTDGFFGAVWRRVR